MILRLRRGCLGIALDDFHLAVDAFKQKHEDLQLPPG